MNKVIILLIILVAALSSCTKSNYTCTCVTAAIGYASVTEVKELHDTKSNAKTTCTNSNYTSEAGDVNISCTFN